ncbi:hypothetical protein ACFE04_006911 [Oxalis oulophora]
MASCIASPCAFLSRSFPKCKAVQGLQVKAHAFREEGRKDHDMVDANLSVLRERIEQTKIKERLERCCKYQHGWNHSPALYKEVLVEKKKKQDKVFVSEFFQLIGLVGGTVGFTCFSATFFVCLLSFLLHFNY